MAKITKPFCETVSPPVSGYKIHWDDRVPGYGLRVTASAVKAFVAQGRVKGKAVIVTIGRFPLYTEDQARKRAQSILQQMRDGIDPRDVKREDEAKAVTLRQVADAFFARPGMLKDSSRDEMDRHIRTTFEKWQHRAIAAITPADCRKRHEEIATKGVTGRGPAPGSATFAFTVLRTLINWAREEYQTKDGKPIIEKNPVAILKKDLAAQAKKVRTRHIDRRDVGMFWHLLTTARENPAFSADTRAGLDLVMFLLLTGTRRNEGAMLTWDRVNLNDDDPADNWFHLPGPKNKNPVWLPLSSQAAAVLKARKQADERAPSKFVFPSRSAAGHIMDTRAPLERFSVAIGMDRLSAHDLRRSFVTLGVKACRLDIAKLELLTNHKPQGVTAKHYLETSDLRDYHPEVQAIGDYIEQQALIASGGNVVPLARPA